jgi:hypothetical protein
MDHVETDHGIGSVRTETEYSEHQHRFCMTRVFRQARTCGGSRFEKPTLIQRLRHLKWPEIDSSGSGSGRNGRGKKDAVIAMMKRAKGATLAEIVAATGWQKHTVRGFVSILCHQGGEKVESSKNAGRARTCRIANSTASIPQQPTPPRPSGRGGFCCVCGPRRGTIP